MNFCAERRISWFPRCATRVRAGPGAGFNSSAASSSPGWSNTAPSIWRNLCGLSPASRNDRTACSTCQTSEPSLWTRRRLWTHFCRRSKLRTRRSERDRCFDTPGRSVHTWMCWRRRHTGSSSRILRICHLFPAQGGPVQRGPGGRPDAHRIRIGKSHPVDSDDADRAAESHRLWMAAGRFGARCTSHQRDCHEPLRQGCKPV